MRLDKIAASPVDVATFPEIEALPVVTLHRSSSNNMMCVVEFEPLPADEMEKIEDIFAVR